MNQLNIEHKFKIKGNFDLFIVCIWPWATGRGNLNEGALDQGTTGSTNYQHRTAATLHTLETFRYESLNDGVTFCGMRC